MVILGPTNTLLIQRLLIQKSHVKVIHHMRNFHRKQIKAVFHKKKNTAYYSGTTVNYCFPLILVTYYHVFIQFPSLLCPATEQPQITCDFGKRIRCFQPKSLLELPPALKQLTTSSFLKMSLGATSFFSYFSYFYCSFSGSSTSGHLLHADVLRNYSGARSPGPFLVYTHSLDIIFT